MGMGVCVCVCARACVCVCVCVRLTLFEFVSHVQLLLYGCDALLLTQLDGIDF